MLVSGIIVSASLVGILAVLFIGGVGLAMLDKHLDQWRQH